jgi:hypothetical protein
MMTSCVPLSAVQVGSWNLLSVCISMPLIRSFPRRSLMLTGSALMSFGLLLMAANSFFFPAQRSIPSIVGILIFIFGFEIGPGPLFFILAAEAFPSLLLHAGLSLTNQLAWLHNCLITLLFPLMNAAIGAAGTFAIFLLINLLAMLAYTAVLPKHTEKATRAPTKSQPSGAIGWSGAPENFNGMESAIELQRSSPAESGDLGLSHTTASAFSASAASFKFHLPTHLQPQLQQQLHLHLQLQRQRSLATIPICQHNTKRSTEERNNHDDVDTGNLTAETDQEASSSMRLYATVAAAYERAQVQAKQLQTVEKHHMQSPKHGQQ